MLQQYEDYNINMSSGESEIFYPYIDDSESSKTNSRFSKCLTAYYVITSLVSLAALSFSIYATFLCQQLLEKINKNGNNLFEENLFPKIYHLIQYFAAVTLTLFILITFLLISLSAQENRDMISLNLILMMCQRCLLLPQALYLSYKTSNDYLTI